MESLIPTLPGGLSLKEQIKFYASISDKCESASLTHINWFTHKRERGIYCWICDQQLLIRKYETIIDELLLTKSPPDLTTNMSRKKSRTKKRQVSFGG